VHSPQNLIPQMLLQPIGAVRLSSIALRPLGSPPLSAATGELFRLVLRHPVQHHLCTSQRLWKSKHACHPIIVSVVLGHIR